MNRGGPAKYGNIQGLTYALRPIPEYRAGRLRLSRYALLVAEAAPGVVVTGQPPTLDANQEFKRCAGARSSLSCFRKEDYNRSRSTEK